MFCGYFEEGAVVTIPFVTRGSSNQPVDPDAAPTFRVFGAAGPVSGGSGTASDMETGDVEGASNESPIEIESEAHGLATGAYVEVSGVGGNDAANGNHFVTVTGADTFTLDDSTGDGAYTSGGAWQTIGLWKIVLSGAVLSSLAAGKTYTVHVTWEESSAARHLALTFTVH